MSFIKFWRDRRGLTLQALGDAIDPPASAGTIHSYESGARDVSLKRLVAIANALGVRPGELLDGPAALPTPNELAAMLENAQAELPVGVSYADYPTAVAASLHEQLRLYARDRANARAAKPEPSTSPAEDAPARTPTRRAVKA